MKIWKMIPHHLTTSDLIQRVLVRRANTKLVHMQAFESILANNLHHDAWFTIDLALVFTLNIGLGFLSETCCSAGATAASELPSLNTSRHGPGLY